jgi:pimeloyl-ACP methyl ester carboxylesterase
MAAFTLPKALSRRVLELAEGDTGLPRRVKVTTWGTPLAQAKLTVIYAGGAPTSAEEPTLHSANFATDIYAERGIHLVAIDKPGMGGTSFNSRFQIRRDYPRLVARVADELGVGKYGVVGISNGGPYVMALLTAPDDSLRARVLAASMVVGVSDVSASGYFGVRHASGCFEGIFNSLPIVVGGPLIRMGLGAAAWALFGPLGQYDKNATPPFQNAESKEVVRRILADGGANQGRGFALDSQQGLSPLYARPRTDVPGSELSAASAYRQIPISVPVALWYGRVDATVPLRTADWLAEQIPHATKHYVDEAGHSLYIDHAPAVLDRLLQGLARA